MFIENVCNIKGNMLTPMSIVISGLHLAQFVGYNCSLFPFPHPLSFCWYYNYYTVCRHFYQCFIIKLCPKKLQNCMFLGLGCELIISQSVIFLFYNYILVFSKLATRCGLTKLRGQLDHCIA